MHAPRLDSISNGADDDGSGTIALIEIAQAFMRGDVRPKRSILLVSHTAEEKGLLGSAWYTDHATVPIDSIVAEFDVDMIGRGAATDIKAGGPTYLEVVGLRRLSKEFGDWVETANAREPVPFVFNYEYDAPGHPEQYYCRADHYSYARYGIPSVVALARRASRLSPGDRRAAVHRLPGLRAAHADGARRRGVRRQRRPSPASRRAEADRSPRPLPSITAECDASRWRPTNRAPHLAPDDQALVPALARARHSRGAGGVVAHRRRPGNRSTRCHSAPVGTIISAIRRSSSAGSLGSSPRSVRTWNPPSLVRWNADKRYLLDLARRGVPTDPDDDRAARRRRDVEAIVIAEGWQRVVVKPASQRAATRRMLRAPFDARRARTIAAWPVGDVLVQPFAEEISRDGEFSFTFIDGQFSHAALKRARRAGEFRVQTEHGGSVEQIDAEPGLVEQAARVLTPSTAYRFTRV